MSGEQNASEVGGPVDPCDRQPAGRSQGAAGLPYRWPAPCLPQAVSYDPADIECAHLHQRMLSDPGEQPRRGQVVVGHVVAWWAGPWGLGGQAAGWKKVVPCLALMLCDGRLIRLFGWDVIADWSKIVVGTDPAAVAGGVDVYARSAVDPAGEHWWWVIGRAGE